MQESPSDDWRIHLYRRYQGCGHPSNAMLHIESGRANAVCVAGKLERLRIPMHDAICSNTTEHARKRPTFDADAILDQLFSIQNGSPCPFTARVWCGLGGVLPQADSIYDGGEFEDVAWTKQKR